MTRYRILSFDGGGIRGLITAILLERLEQQHPGFLSQVDLFAGTSTGGLLALGLAYGKTPTQLRDLYEKHGAEVFADTVLDDIRDLGTLIGADYGIEPLKNALTEQFGANLRMRHLPKSVLISTFDLDNAPTTPGVTRTWKAKFFHNFPEAGPDLNEKVVDVAIYTAAAPTYFPIYKGYIDGGVVAGNPSMCALAQALHPETGGQKLRDAVLLSLGTGHNPRYLETLDGDWGLVQWAPKLVDLVLEGSSGLVDYQCQQILGKRYLRLDPLLPFPIGMDRVDQMPVLVDIANQCPLGDAIAWLNQYF
jgi:patatin-like phospholipase/acyl hydrolase